MIFHIFLRFRTQIQRLVQIEEQGKPNLYNVSVNKKENNDYPLYMTNFFYMTIIQHLLVLLRTIIPSIYFRA